VTSRSPVRVFVNPVDEARADAIGRVLHRNNVAISRLVEKAMTGELSVAEREMKRLFYAENSKLVTELKAMPMAGNVGVV
jgi:hypothetical protein